MNKGLPSIATLAWRRTNKWNTHGQTDVPVMTAASEDKRNVNMYAKARF